MSDHYLAPKSNHANNFVGFVTRHGLSLRGTRVLEVKGRKSGLPRQTPVNLLEFEGDQYLVSPRGQTEWVRNVRSDQGQLTLILGRKRDERTAVELSDAEKVAVLREYLRRWSWEVGKFFGGVGAKATDEELSAIAPRHPVFKLSPAAS